MTTLVQISQIETLQGQSTVLHDIDWHQFEAILEDLGDRRASRIAYFDGVLEIRMPLPEHEVDKELIGDSIKILLDRLLRDYECFGSTTFKKENMMAGIEPENCFYIQNHALMIGKRRLNLADDPPPDLVLEVDVTSRTARSAYVALGVPELWQYADRKLQIFLLQDGEYIESAYSPLFPQYQIARAISRCVELSLSEGRGAAIRAFRAWVNQTVC
jgi:Uma2 family endonuclease